MSRSIGGKLDLAALALLTGSTGRKYPDRQALRAAAAQLRGRGLSDHDVAHALGVDDQVVRELLGEGRA